METKNLKMKGIKRRIPLDAAHRQSSLNSHIKSQKTEETTKHKNQSKPQNKSLNPYFKDNNLAKKLQSNSKFNKLLTNKRRSIVESSEQNIINHPDSIDKQINKSSFTDEEKLEVLRNNIAPTVKAQSSPSKRHRDGSLKEHGNKLHISLGSKETSMKEVYSQRNKNNFNNEYCLPNVYPKRSKINLLKGNKDFSTISTTSTDSATAKAGRLINHQSTFQHLPESMTTKLLEKFMNNDALKNIFSKDYSFQDTKDKIRYLREKSEHSSRPRKPFAKLGEEVVSSRHASRGLSMKHNETSPNSVRQPTFGICFSSILKSDLLKDQSSPIDLTKRGLKARRDLPKNEQINEYGITKHFLSKK